MFGLSFFLLAFQTAALTVYNDEHHTFVNSPQLHFGLAWFNVTSSLFDAGSDLCNSDESNLPSVDSIMLVHSGGCSFERKARHAQQLGVAALVVFRELDGKLVINV